METEGPQTEEGRKQEAESNVVRLPREYIGSREDLIPIGPRADDGRPPEPDWAGPPSADDFWGEGSAAVQDALQGPAPSPAGAAGLVEDAPENMNRGTRSAGRVATQMQWPRRVSYRVRRPEPSGAPRSAKRWIVASALLVAVIVAGIRYASDSSTGGHFGASSSGTSIALRTVDQGLGGVAAGFDHVAATRSRPHTGARRGPATRAHPARPQDHSRARAAATVFTASGANPSTGGSSYAGASGTGLSQGSNTSAYGAGGSGGSPLSSGGSGGESQAAPAGPTPGPSTPFGPGTFGSGK